MNFLSLNNFMKLINVFRKKKITQRAMCQHQGATRVTADVSTGSADADVIVVKDDVSVDWSTLTQSMVNGWVHVSAVSGSH